MKKWNILYGMVVLVILGSILGLYKINALLPDGILVSGIPMETIEEMYQELYDGWTAYDMDVGMEYSNVDISYEDAQGGMSGVVGADGWDKDPGAVLLTPKKDVGQILAFTLQEKFPDAYVRDLATERGMRLSGLLFLSCIVLFVTLNRLVFGLLGEKGKEYRYLLRLVEFFAFFLLVQSRGLLPTVCIPQKFVFFGEWRAKCRGYFGRLHAMGKIPCANYQECTALQWVFLAMLFAGIVGGIVVGWNRRKNR